MWHISTVRFVNVNLVGMAAVLDSMERSMRNRLTVDGCIYVSSARYFEPGDVLVLASTGYNESEGDNDEHVSPELPAAIPI